MHFSCAIWLINSSDTELFFFLLTPRVICGLFAVIVNTEKRCPFNVEGAKESAWVSRERVVSLMISRSVSAGRYLHVDLIWWRAIDLDRVLEMQKLRCWWIGQVAIAWFGDWRR